MEKLIFRSTFFPKNTTAAKGWIFRVEFFSPFKKCISGRQPGRKKFVPCFRTRSPSDSRGLTRSKRFHVHGEQVVSRGTRRTFVRGLLSANGAHVRHGINDIDIHVEVTSRTASLSSCKNSYANLISTIEKEKSKRRKKVKEEMFQTGFAEGGSTKKMPIEIVNYIFSCIISKFKWSNLQQFTFPVI